MRKPSKPAIAEPVRLYLMAGLATSPDFMDEFRSQLEGMFHRETGQAAEGKMIHPYGDWSRRVWPQFREIRHDLRLSFMRTGNSLGGNQVLPQLAAPENSANGRVVLIGHSGGGVAALHGAMLLMERQPEADCLVIQIGSPRCRVPPALRSRTAFYYAADSKSYGKDPICRLGGWGGWARGKAGVPYWKQRLFAPGSIVPVPIAGGHADYFRTHLTDANGQSNMEKLMSEVWAFILAHDRGRGGAEG